MTVAGGAPTCDPDDVVDVALSPQSDRPEVGVRRSSSRSKWLVAVVLVVSVAGLFAWTSLRGSSPTAVVRAVAVSCGGTMTLVIDAEHLDEGPYELQASIGPRFLPVLNSMTQTLVGSEDDHQYLVPDDGDLRVVATLPAGLAEVDYALLRVGAGDRPVVANETLEVEECSL